MAKGRMQNRHGTYSQLTSASTPLLPEEIGIVDSGHPDTTDGKAVYYRTASGEPVRLANANEVLKIYRVNEETVPQSINWYDLRGNPEIPTTFVGFTGEAPELIYWDEEKSIWALVNITFNSRTEEYFYLWEKMLTSGDM